MPSSYFAPATAAILFSARIIELRCRRSSHPGEIIAPATFHAMFATGIIVTCAAFTEFFTTHPTFSGWLFLVGLGLGLASFALRAWSANALGDFWSTQVEIRPDHQLVTTGPYRHVRHPIYFGAILELLGAIVILQAPYTLVPFICLFLPVLLWRIRVEEEAMVKQLGAKYERYMQQVPSLVPLPWRRMP